MVIRLIAGLAGTVVGLIFFGLFVSRSSQIGIGPAGQEVADAIGSLGKGIGEIGGGFAALGTGFGTGITGLFAPFVNLATFFGLVKTQATATSNAIVSATQPSTNQQSTKSGGGSTLITGFLAGPGGL